MSSPIQSLDQLRKSIREKRQQLSREQQKNASAVITQKIMASDFFQQAHHIAYYFSDDAEIDPTAILETAEEHQKHNYIPVLEDHHGKVLHFYAYEKNDPLENNRFGIPEPKIKRQPPINACDLDLVFVPLVAFDNDGNRLGRGAGYYDRSFAFIAKNPDQPRPLLVGLAYDFQRVDALTPAPWDIPLDYVITEKI